MTDSASALGSDSAPGRRAGEPAAGLGALVLGAGRGERLGHTLPKAFVPLSGVALIERSIRALAASGLFQRIQPVLAESEFLRFEGLGLVGPMEGVEEGVMAPVAGGLERQDSMCAGLAALPTGIDLVAVHDAARCLVSESDLRAVVARARETGAAILGERAKDTIKRVVAGQIVETPVREECWAAQTPQVIRRDWLEEAVRAATEAQRYGTDDAQLVEWTGHAVVMVEAKEANPKMTHREDLLLAERLLAEQKDVRGVEG